MSGHLGNLSPSQEEALDELLEMLDQDGSLGDDFTDSFLLRFLRARRFDVKKAYNLLKAERAWRIQENVENVLNEPLPEALKPGNPYWRGGYHGLDKKGNPVFVDFVGGIDIEVLKQISVKEYVRHRYIRQMEIGNKIMRDLTMETGRPIEAVTHIVCLKGLGKKHLNKDIIKAIKEGSQLMQDMYPETMANTLILNQPWIFSAFWAIFKPLLTKETTAKIHFLGTDYEKLKEWVDEAHLPEFFGGYCGCHAPDDCIPPQTPPSKHKGKGKGKGEADVEDEVVNVTSVKA